MDKHNASPAPGEDVSLPARGAATLEEIDIRSALDSRPNRPPDYEAEHRALAALIKEMAENPRNMLQRLAEAAVELCRADTAGISILEGEVFRWEALAGVFAEHRNGTMPRDASPCGVCIDRDATQLMHLADRYFPAVPSEPRFVEVLLIPFHYHGKPVGTVWVVAHNFERKFDREDERVVRTLAQFASAGWQLWKAYEAATETSRHKDEFVAMLGHELRNPLAAILIASEVLKKLGIDEPHAIDAVNVMARQGQHLRRMIDDLIDLSRINHHKLDLQRQPVELRMVIADAVDTMRAQIEHHRHRLSTRIPAAPIWLDGDLVRLTQLLSNLLDNSVKYTPDGGEISIAAELAGDEVYIQVSDSGAGIPKNRLDSIFDLFTQLDRPAAAGTAGLGLGLTLARTLAELHGGSVKVLSDGPGQGSQFTVRLPILRRSSPGAQANQAAQQPAELPRRRILLVEDSNDIAQGLGAILSMHGHSVEIAQNGAEALSRLRSFEPDVVLLDIGLPDMDGYAVARQIRKQVDRADVAIVALSGYGQEEDRRKAREAGCDDHLVKPIQIEVLLGVLDRLRR